MNDTPTPPVWRALSGIDSLDDLMRTFREPRSWSDRQIGYVQTVLEMHPSEHDDVLWALVEVVRLASEGVSRSSVRILAHPYRFIAGVFHFASLDERDHPASVTCPEAFLARADVTERCSPWRRRWRAAARGDGIDHDDD